MHIWVDADACPKVIKEILYRAAERLRIPLTLVANRPLRVPPSPYIKTLKVPAGFDVDLDPVSLFIVDPGLPLGTHEFSCRMLDPVTGRLLREDRNFFEVQ